MTRQKMNPSRRIEAIVLLEHGLVSLAEAMALLGVSRAQIYRLRSCYRKGGAEELNRARRARTRHSGRAVERRRAMRFIMRHYADYGPTLAAEVLACDHGIALSRETIRRDMIAAGLRGRHWRAPRQARRRRERTACYGGQVQADGSAHAWFEDRGPPCTAMVFIDDATGRIQQLRFYQTETTEAYLESTARMCLEHGKPIRIVTDRHSAVFGEKPVAQFPAAMTRAGICHSYANSPQSKGRVERLNRVLQDRLVKWFRRKGISDVAAANDVIARFVREFNDRFARPPRVDSNVHRAVSARKVLLRELAARYSRMIDRNGIFSLHGKLYQQDRSTSAPDCQRAKRRAEVRSLLNGCVEIRVGSTWRTAVAVT